MELVLEQVSEDLDERAEPADRDPIVLAEPVALLTEEELDAFREP